MLGVLLVALVAVGSWLELPTKMLAFGLGLLMLGTALSTYLGLIVTASIGWTECVLAAATMIALMMASTYTASPSDADHDDRRAAERPRCRRACIPPARRASLGAPRLDAVPRGLDRAPGDVNVNGSTCALSQRAGGTVRLEIHPLVFLVGSLLLCATWLVAASHAARAGQRPARPLPRGRERMRASGRRSSLRPKS